MNLKVSIVINTLNRLSTLPNTLKALQYLRYPTFEVIVVNGPSTDGTQEYLSRDWSNKIKLCSCPLANLSLSRNIGIENAAGDVVCFIDDDAIPEPDWLDKIVSSYVDDSIGAVGGWARDNSGVHFQTKYIASSLDGTSKIDFDNESDLNSFIKSHQDYFAALIGVNSSFRRKVLDELRGFDEEYQYYLEETDLIYRINKAGWRVEMLPDAEVHHKVAPSNVRRSTKILSSYTQIAKSTAYFILKNGFEEKKLSELFYEIENRKSDFRANVQYWLENQLISEEDSERLLSEIEFGIREGIRDAFRLPLRRLRDLASPSQFKQFPTFKDKFRIALVSDLYPPKPCGGVAVFITALAKELAKRGNEVTVITLSDGDSTVDFEDGVWVHRIKDTYQSKPLSSSLNLEGISPQLPVSLANRAKSVLEELDRVNPRREFQYVLGTIWDLNIAEVIASKRYPVGMCLVTSYKLMESSKPEWKKDLKFYQDHVCKMIEAEKWAIQNCTQIFASTSAILNDVESHYDITIDRSKVNLIPFGIRESFRVPTENNGNTEEVVLLFVGRLEKRKGIEELLSVLPRLCVKYKSLQVRIVGNNEIKNSRGRTYQDEFIEQNNDKEWIGRVNFLGQVDDGTLENEYASCDIFVAPSLYESFGLIYLEAMRVGKPCIGCSVGGIPEVVEDGVTGILAKPGDIESLFLAISNLIEEPSLRALMGKNGRKRFEEKFKIDVFAQKIEKAIQPICDK